MAIVGWGLERTLRLHRRVWSDRVGFSLIELLVSIAIIALLIGILLPTLSAARNQGRMAVSLSNLRQLMIAQETYRYDYEGWLPVDLPRTADGSNLKAYTSQWIFGGKYTNEDEYWAEVWDGVFDVPAWARPLNPYVYPTIDFVQKRGPTTVQERRDLELPFFESPGDVFSIRRAAWWGISPDEIVPEDFSSYDDVGTSYGPNVYWMMLDTGLSDRYPRLGPRYRAGVRLLRSGQVHASSLIWLHDQTTDLVVPDTLAKTPAKNVQGEFGGANRSAVAFFDGRAVYQELEPGQWDTGSYRFLISDSGRAYLPQNNK